MIPIDFRNETFEQVRKRGLEGLRGQVFRAFEKFGPCTTAALAQHLESPNDLGPKAILTVRPRATELYQLGMLELVNPESRGGEGIYRAVMYPVHQARFAKLQAEAREAQLPLL